MPLDISNAVIPVLVTSPVGGRRDVEMVCDCAGITRDDLDHAVRSLKADLSLAAITPAKIYLFLGKRPRCGGCFSAMMAPRREPALDEMPVPILTF